MIICRKNACYVKSGTFYHFSLGNYEIFTQNALTNTIMHTSHNLGHKISYSML